MSVYVWDDDDDKMDVEFYWKNGSLIYIYENDEKIFTLIQKIKMVIFAT